MVSVSTPKGTRDFNSEEVYKRQYIMGVIRKYFERYGFQPIETPTMEMLSTLTGKYGEEGDTLLFKVLNSGDWKKELAADDIANKKSSQLISKVSEKGLRYDLTIPFARYVVMHQNEIHFPFKRYQMQAVYRADRPQKGRYREFWQCDADVIGTDSLISEWELVKIYDEVFAELKVSVEIKINNRKILQGIAEYCGCSNNIILLTTAIDKFDKIGKNGVKSELLNNGLIESSIDAIFDCIFPTESDWIFYTKEQLLQIGYSSQEADDEILLQESGFHKDFGMLNCLDYNFRNSPNLSEVGFQGINEVKKIFQYLGTKKSTNAKVSFDPTLARGLNYYTGAIFEVKAKDVEYGSIGGGGRYDDLTGMFGLKNISGVGISFGLDRIYDVLEELKKFPATISNGTKVLFANFDEKSEQYCLPLLQMIREAGIASEIYPAAVKMAKQMKYADARKIPFVILAGENEIQSGKLTLKNMQSGEQQLLSIEEIIQQLK